MAKTGKKNFYKIYSKEIELGIIITITLLTIIFWENIVFYPIKLFVVMFHEISHGLATVFTGGKINFIQFNSKLGGLCSASGGNKFIIASSGYIGSLIVGILLFIFAYDYKKIQILNFSLALILIFFTANYFVDPVNIVFALVFAIVLLVAPKYLPAPINAYLMKTIGLISSLYVLTDIKEDLLTLTYRETDAQTLAGITSINAIIWGLLWFLITGIAIYFLFKYGYKKGINR